MDEDLQNTLGRMMEVIDSCGLTFAAKTLGIPKSTLRSAVDRGEIPHEKDLAGEVRVSLDAVRAWSKNRPAIGRPKRVKPE